MKYEIYGPFELPKSGHGFDPDTKRLSAFWNDVSDSPEGAKELPDACGCYLFANRAGRGITPLYVGMAKRQPFKKECFSNHKIVKLFIATANKKGTPLLFLIAKTTPKDRFVKPSKNNRSRNNSIDFLETFLMGMALMKNPELLNKSNTKALRETKVPGILNSPQGRLSTSAKNLKKALGI